MLNEFARITTRFDSEQVDFTEKGSRSKEKSGRGLVMITPDRFSEF
jgi:hypothetical protein